MDNNKLILRIIIALSVIVPVLVAILLYTPIKLDLDVEWVKQLPAFNAIINSTTSVLLLVALIVIKKKKIKWHKNLMMLCFVLGTVFLISYVMYHSTMPSVKFGDINGDGVLQPEELESVGISRSLYVVLLLTHIGFSILVVPMVLMAFYYALTP